LGDEEAAITIVQNLICVLPQRLRKKDEPNAIRVKGKYRKLTGYEFDPQTVLRNIERTLPTKGLFKKITVRKELKAGDFLSRQGNDPDEFYFIHSGVLDVIVDKPGRPSRIVNVIEAPNIAGEVGFFSGEKHTASLRAKNDVVYTPFSSDDYKKVHKKSAKDALCLLYAAAQLTVHLIVQKESL
jgi:hypothetical protein